MKKVLIICVMHLILACTVASAIDAVEPPKSCKQCGMDRLAFARSRMLIAYSDGTTVGVCSLHCATAELHNNRDKQVNSIMVADYSTKRLLDAKTAVWVVGGKKKGVMTSLAKWAFARMEDARRFLRPRRGRRGCRQPTGPTVSEG